MALFKLTCIEEWIGLSHKSVVVLIKYISKTKLSKWNHHK
jgi:hypothetical protein